MPEHFPRAINLLELAAQAAASNARNALAKGDNAEAARAQDLANECKAAIEKLNKKGRWTL